MKVLIDWDQPNLSSIYAIKKGIKLITYGICKWLHIRPKFVEEIYRETDEYMLTLSRLNELIGVQTIFGVRDNVKAVKEEVINKLPPTDDVRRHIHLGHNRDPNRQRLWEPALQQTKSTWHYDEDYYHGHEVTLKEGELPVFHVDRPYRLQTYIKYLYEHRANLSK
jgi:hypothetical protein